MDDPSMNGSPPPDVPPDMFTCGNYSSNTSTSATPPDPSGYSGTCGPQGAGSYTMPGYPYPYDPYRLPTTTTSSEPSVPEPSSSDGEMSERNRQRLEELLEKLYDASRDRGLATPEELRVWLTEYQELTGKDKPGFMTY